MDRILERIEAADAARRRIIGANRGLTATQAAVKAATGGWSVQAHIEHLVLSEQRGVQRIWLAAEALRRGVPFQVGEAVHRGLPIEEVIARTWKPKEKAMAETDPVGEGPLSYWIARYEACQTTLERVPQVLSGLGPVPGPGSALPVGTPGCLPAAGIPPVPHRPPLRPDGTAEEERIVSGRVSRGEDQRPSVAQPLR